MDDNISVSPYRFLELGIFCINSVMTCVTYYQYESVSTTTSFYFDITLSEVSWTMNIYAISNVVLTLFGSWFVERKGIRMSLLACALLNFLGNALKCGSVDPKRFYLVVIGQGVASISQVFVLILPSRIAGVWFGADQVSTATSVAVSSFAIGNVLGILIPRSSIPESKNPIHIGEALQILQYYYLGGSTLVFLLTVLCCKDKPPSPPSKASATRNNGGRDSDAKFCSIVSSLVQNSNVTLSLVAFGISAAVNYWYISIFPFLGINFFENFKETINWIELYYISIGAPLSILTGIWLDKTKYYKSTAIAMNIILIISVIVLAIVLHLAPDVFWLYIPTSLMWFCPYLTVTYEFRSEIAYPDNEHILDGLHFTSLWLVVLILSPVIFYLEYFFERHKELLILSLLGGLLLIGLTILAFVKPNYRRQAAEDRTFNTSQMGVNNNQQDYTPF